jgi:hypothetical protein
MNTISFLFVGASAFVVSSLFMARIFKLYRERRVRLMPAYARTSDHTKGHPYG